MSAEAGWVKRHPVLSLVALVLLLGLLANLAKEDEPSTTSAGDGSARTESTVEAREPNKRKPSDKNVKNGKVGKGSKKPTGKPKQKPPPRSYLVTGVVDGDTIELGNGETVRLVGIDTPEIGECGFERASEVLADLVLHEQVRLTVSDEDRDQYDRLLRYVDVGTMDAGLRLIKRGLATARYDSRDGYGYHPREPVYIAADERSPDVFCPRPQPLVRAPQTGGGKCAPGYDPCVPPYPPDLDCADVNGPVHVTGSDPHGLDADGDGTACES